MGEKTKVAVVAETVLVDGIYHTEQRSGKDRRQARQTKWRFYERRHVIDPRHNSAKQINEEV